MKKQFFILLGLIILIPQAFSAHPSVSAFASPNDQFDTDNLTVYPRTTDDFFLSTDASKSGGFGDVYAQARIKLYNSMGIYFGGLTNDTEDIYPDQYYTSYYNTYVYKAYLYVVADANDYYWASANATLNW